VFQDKKLSLGRLLFLVAIFGVFFALVNGWLAGRAFGQSYTAAPGVVVSNPGTGGVFPNSSQTGVVVAFPTPEGYPVDWDALRKQRLREAVQSIEEKIFFNFDSAALTVKARDEAIILAAVLRSNPDVNLVIEGHADHVGTEDYNLQLSLRRATVIYYLLTGQGVENERLSVQAFGEDAPVLRRANQKERRQNRRVEFHLVDGFTGESLN
jgi:outer membrane protein OmpA-like peptidoglycan-associated protein